MIKQLLKNILPLSIAILSLTGCGDSSIKHNNDYLLLRFDTLTSSGFYVNTKGDTIIPPGKYAYFYIDTFRTFTIVSSRDRYGYYAIDRNEKFLYNVLSLDGLPEYVYATEEGLFRIESGGKIGFANLEGDIVIPPLYSCAYYFREGKAKVSLLPCDSIKDDEHLSWKSKQWLYIDKTGRMIED
jgi:hypothetical protein